MLERFFPDEYMASTYVIPFEKLYKEGYRGIIFDIDNTLVPHGAPADERSKKLFHELKSMGYSCCLLSNNQEPRVKMFNEEIGVHYICNAHKPAVKNYRKAMSLMGTNRETTLFVGDQLFTDVWGAEKDWNPKYSRASDSSKGRNPDRVETLSGKNRTSFLYKRKEETRVKLTCPGQLI